MQRQDFELLLYKAIETLYIKDAMLLERDFDINERTITHRLAVHLTPLFEDYDVDCEYNRMLYKDNNFTAGDFWTKTLELKPPAGVTAEDDEAITVYPDIIIHKRKTNANLAVVEVKMEWKNGKKDFDLLKLKAYRSDFNYKFAVYLELRENMNNIVPMFQ